MTHKQGNDFFEGIKSGFGIYGNYTVKCYYNGIITKLDCQGEVRLVIIPTTVHDWKLKKETNYCLILKPKKNTLSWNSYDPMIREFPSEILKAIGDKYYLNVNYVKEII